jgi:hypothetical protein
MRRLRKRNRNMEPPAVLALSLRAAGQPFVSSGVRAYEMKPPREAEQETAAGAGY